MLTHTSALTAQVATVQSRSVVSANVQNGKRISAVASQLYNRKDQRGSDGTVDHSIGLNLPLAITPLQEGQTWPSRRCGFS